MAGNEDYSGQYFQWLRDRHPRRTKANSIAIRTLPLSPLPSGLWKNRGGGGVPSDARSDLSDYGMPEGIP
jgi:hypothetical protein